uniref:Uncharacterized protein n=1 Tax=Anguilla anguilla TaxID=7936 RepID=A0A0E9QE16_ANGAN
MNRYVLKVFINLSLSLASLRSESTVRQNALT